MFFLSFHHRFCVVLLILFSLNIISCKQEEAPAAPTNYYSPPVREPDSVLDNYYERLNQIARRDLGNIFDGFWEGQDIAIRIFSFLKDGKVISTMEFPLIELLTDKELARNYQLPLQGINPDNKTAFINWNNIFQIRLKITTHQQLKVNLIYLNDPSKNQTFYLKRNVQDVDTQRLLGHQSYAFKIGQIIETNQLHSESCQLENVERHISLFEIKCLDVLFNNESDFFDSKKIKSLIVHSLKNYNYLFLKKLVDRWEKFSLPNERVKESLAEFMLTLIQTKLAEVNTNDSLIKIGIENQYLYLRKDLVRDNLFEHISNIVLKYSDIFNADEIFTFIRQSIELKNLITPRFVLQLIDRGILGDEVYYKDHIQEFNQQVIDILNMWHAYQVYLKAPLTKRIILIKFLSMAYRPQDWELFDSIVMFKELIDNHDIKTLRMLPYELIQSNVIDQIRDYINQWIQFYRIRMEKISGWTLKGYIEAYIRYKELKSMQKYFLQS